MATYADLIKDALQDLNAYQAGETPSSEDLALGLNRLNGLLDQFAGERLLIYTITRSTFTIVSGTAAYTVGTGATVSIPRPLFIEHVNFQDTSFDPDLEMPLMSLTDDAYAAIPQKALTNTYPTCWYYNPTFTTVSPYGTLTFWPVPTSSTIEGVIYAATQLSEASSTSDTFLMPPGYKRMLRTNLALELAAPFEKEPSAALVNMANESKVLVQRENVRLMDLSVDTATLGDQAARGRNWSAYVGP